MPLCDAGGTQGRISVGCGLSEQRETYAVKLESLMNSLDEVKAVYLTKFGEDRDLDAPGRRRPAPIAAAHADSISSDGSQRQQRPGLAEAAHTGSRGPHRRQQVAPAASAGPGTSGPDR